MGGGASWTQKLPPGLTVKSLKKHPSLIPLHAVVLFGCCLATVYTARLCIRTPDVSFNRFTNQHPWRNWKQSHQYKFYSPSINYAELQEDPNKPKLE